MSMALKLLLAALGGGVGAALRVLINSFFPSSGVWMGLGTWLINTIGCLLIGVFAGWLTTCAWSEESKVAFQMLTMAGFCGGFSTFSHYTLDCVKYIEGGHPIAMIVYAILTVVVGLLFCALGYWFGQKL